MKICLISLAIYCAASNAVAREFVNLGFEGANVGGVEGGPSGGSGPADRLLPGWQLYHKGERLQLIGYNAFSLGAGPRATIFDSQAPFAVYRPSEFRINGEFALKLQDSVHPGDPLLLVQTGDVPEWANVLSIKFEPRRWDVRLNEEPVPVLDLIESGADKYALYDISAFSGQTVTLSLIAPRSLDPFSVTYFGYIDDVRFIPEPSTLGITAVGGVMFIYATIHRRRRSPDRLKNGSERPL